MSGPGENQWEEFVDFRRIVTRFMEGMNEDMRKRTELFETIQGAQTQLLDGVREIKDYLGELEERIECQERGFE